MTGMQWGRIIITLVVPLLVALYLLLLIRRNASRLEIEAEYGGFTKGAMWVVGFLLTMMLGTYFGIYLSSAILTANQMGGTSLKGVASVVMLIGLYIGSLLGALVPYRMIARAGKWASVWPWPVIALVYAVLYYFSTKLF